MEGPTRPSRAGSEEFDHSVSRRRALRLAGMTVAAGAGAYAADTALTPAIAEAQSSNVYVIVNQSGGGDYTNLEQAIQSVAPNTTILVKSGLYTIQSGNMRPATGVRIIGEGYGTHVQAVNGMNASLFILEYDNIVLENLRIDGNGANQNLASGNGVYIDGVQRCRVVGCWVHDSAGYNIVLFPGSKHCAVLGNHVYSALQMGIELQGASYCSVVGNTVNGSGETGIFLWNSSGDCGYNAVAGNTVHACEDGIHIEDNAHDNAISGNTAISNSRYGIAASGVGSNTLVGNVSRLNGSDGIHVESSSNFVVADNLVDDNGRMGIYIRTAPGCAVTGNVVKNSKWNGIEISSGSSSPIAGSVCSGNVCVGNGNGAVGGQQAGIHIRQAEVGIPLNGNLCYDGGSNTQLYGIAVTDSSASEVLLQGNALSGNVQSGLSIASGNAIATTPDRILQGISVGPNQTAVRHGLPYVPVTVSICMTSPGTVWRSAPSDATNVYVTADAPKRTADIAVG